MSKRRKKRAKTREPWPRRPRGCVDLNGRPRRPDPPGPIVTDSRKIDVILHDENDHDSSYRRLHHRRRCRCCRWLRWHESNVVFGTRITRRTPPLCLPQPDQLQPATLPLSSSAMDHDGREFKESQRTDNVQTLRSEARKRPRASNCMPILSVHLLVISCCLFLAAAPILLIDSADDSVIIETDLGQLFKGLRLRSNSYVAARGRHRPVSTNGTRVNSDYDNDVIAFLGIRYASAPVKRLRFMPPTPFNYAPNQVHDGRQFGPICMQRFPLELSRRQMELIGELGGLHEPAPVDGRNHRRQQQDSAGWRRNMKVAGANSMPDGTSANSSSSSSISSSWLRNSDRVAQSKQAPARKSANYSAMGADLQRIQLQLALMADLLPDGGSGPLFATGRHDGRRRRRPTPVGFRSASRRSLFELDQSEDCLNLNIYTPIEALRSRMLGQEPAPQGAAAGDYNSSGRHFSHGDSARPASGHKSLLPVLVVIHGESFDYGSGQTIGGQKFAHDNRLVVVTFNFRLNILGFPPRLSSPTGAATSNSGGGSGSGPRGNLGLLDQVALLHWIQANIGSFGGSSANVTLMGVKRGAIFVNLLMLSPLARGLFSRAIIEDGSALSPMVANNVMAPPPGQQQQQQQQQVAMQHVRLLAHLCNCPIYTPPSRHAVNATGLSAPSAGREQQQHGPVNGQAVPGGPGASGQDETRANGLMFECLKSSPVELIMQQIPFGLIDASHLTQQSSGAGIKLALDRRWHKPLRDLSKTVIELTNGGGGGGGDDGDKRIVPASLKAIWTELYNEMFGATAKANSTRLLLDDEPATKAVAPSGISGLVMISADQLDKLIASLVATKQFVLQALAATRNVDSTTIKSLDEGQQRQTSSSGEVELVFELLDDLLGAIYLPTNETLVSPIYAPQLDSGTILMHNSHDLASSMLQKESPFGRHDLLIGSSAPLVDLSAATRRQRRVPRHEEPSTDKGLNGDINAILDQYYSTSTSSPLSSSSSSSSLLLSFNDNLLYPIERFGKRVLGRVGLTDEQSIQQVSLFVRTYYRYHQQEITNSIINHYYLNFDQQSSSAVSSGKGGASQRPAATDNSGSQADYRAHAKQLHLLQALISAYHDSLISVPLIKTALIHSIKQLEALVDPFIGQHLARISGRIGTGAGGGANEDDMLDVSASQREALATGAVNEFRSFVSQLYDNAQAIVWPIGLLRKPQVGGVGRQQQQQQQAGSIGADLDGVHSTYLYQFGASLDSWLIDKLARSIQRVRMQQNNYNSSRADQFAVRQKKVLSEIEANLADNLLVKLLSNGTIAKFKHQLGLGCSLAVSFSVDEEEDDDNDGDDDDESLTGPYARSEQDSDLVGQLKGWICDKLGRDVVARFVRSGNVNLGAGAEQEPADTGDGSELMQKQLEHYGLSCVQSQQQQGSDMAISEGNGHDDDHHAVQLNSSSVEVTSSSTLTDSSASAATVGQQQIKPTSGQTNCRKQLNRLTMEYLFQEWDGPRGASELQKERDHHWPVFNVFDQHIATLLEQQVPPPAPVEGQNGNLDLWLVESFAHVAESSSSGDDESGAPASRRQTPRSRSGTVDERLSRDNFDRKLAFWANFIQTLNCSRTQPISPNSLLYSSLASNSTLLNMNLNFNCHQQSGGTGGSSTAATTANSMIEAMWAKIRRAISDHINQLIKQQQQARRQMTMAGASQMNIQQSHHSLRMAAPASMTNEVQFNSSQQQDDSPSSPLAAATAQLNGSSSGAYWLTVASDQRQQQLELSPQANQSAWPLSVFSNVTTGTAANRRTLVGLWIIASTILLVGTTLLTSGCVLMNRRRRQQQQQQQLKRKQSSPSSQQQQEVNSVASGGPPPQLDQIDPSCGGLAQLSAPTPISADQEGELLASLQQQAATASSAVNNNRCSSTPSSLTTTRNQQQQQQSHHYHQQHQFQTQLEGLQLVQEPSVSKFEVSNRQMDESGAILDGYHQLSTSFIDYNPLMQQQQQQQQLLDRPGNSSLVQYAYSQDDGDDDQQQIILPIMSVPRHLNAQQRGRQQQLQQQQLAGATDSIRGSCHHLADCSLVLVQNANSNNNLNGKNLKTLNDQQHQQALSSGSETTTATTNRAHSSVSLVSSSTTTTVTNSNINSGCMNGTNGWRQQAQQTKKRVKISDPLRRTGDAGAARHLDDSVDLILAGCDTMSSNNNIDSGNHNDNYPGSSQLYLSSDYLLSPLGRGAGGSQAGQSTTTTATGASESAADFCPIHLANGANYLLAPTPTSVGNLLNGRLDVNCTSSAQFGRQFDQTTGQVQRYLGLVASGQHDSKSDESPIATIGSLSDYLNMNNYDDGTYNSPNGTIEYHQQHQPTLPTNYRIGSIQAGGPQQSRHHSLGNRAASRKRANKTPGATNRVCSVHQNASANNDDNTVRHYRTNNTLNG